MKTLLLDIETSPNLAYVLRDRSRLADNGCLEWTGSRHKGGYGGIQIGGQFYSAHRLACELANGPAPDEDSWALHRCDNPPCINGDHLYWGDAKQNVRDRSERGRDAKGSQTHCKHGHEFTEANTHRRPNGTRACKTCHRNRSRESYHRKAAA